MVQETGKPQYLEIPERGWADVRRLLGLGTTELQNLTTILRTREALRSEKTPDEQIKEQLGLSLREALGLRLAVGSIVRQRRSTKSLADEEALLQDLATICPEEVKELGERRELILALLADSPSAYVTERVEALRFAALPSFVESRTLCELRPVFDEPKENIECGVLVTVLVVTTFESESGEEETHLIQMSRRDVKELKLVLEKAEQKLDKMAAKFGVGGFDVF